MSEIREPRQQSKNREAVLAGESAALQFWLSRSSGIRFRPPSFNLPEKEAQNPSDCTKRNKQFPGLELWPILGHCKSGLNVVQITQPCTGQKAPAAILFCSEIRHKPSAAAAQIVRGIGW